MYQQYFAIEKKLKQNGFDGTREDLILQFTDNAKTSLKSLTSHEYREFLIFLNQMVNKGATYNYNKENRQRKKIISMFHKMGYKLPNGQIDMVHLNEWCNSHGHLHQPLMCYKGADLTKLVTQAEKYYESFIKSV